MQKIDIIRGTRPETLTGPIRENAIEGIYEGKINVGNYFFKKGVVITLSVPNGGDPNELIIHYIIKGQAKYSRKEHEEILSASDTIVLSALSEPMLIETLEDTIFLVIETSGVQDEREPFAKLDELKNALQQRDSYTKEHCDRVSRYAMAIALELGERTKIGSLGQAAIFHDIGKIKIPDNILLKPGRLTDDEFTEMKRHSAYSCEYLKDYFEDEILLTAVSQHHERLDGSGYPEGLKGGDISIGARILMVADVFDALTVSRIYRRKAYTVEESLDIIRRDAEQGKLDPRIVEALQQCLASGKIQVETKKETNG